jgi:hypothetical protein
MPLVVALYRKAAYSPAQHRANDTAILDRTLAHLEGAGWVVTRVGEHAVEPGRGRAPSALPPAALLLNMCQGAAASEALLAIERAGALVINRPSSVLACHRHRLVPALSAHGVRFPATDIVDLADPAPDARSDVVRVAAAAGAPVWVKRGDVHAETADDVVRVPASDAPGVLAAFRARGIRRAALQAHVAGPVLKFYGVADGRFFRCYDAAAGPGGPVPDVDDARLRALVFGAAAALGLDVFGGDVALPSPADPVLIDLNDWPSFAPFRDDAAAAIAGYVLDVVARARTARPVSLPFLSTSDVA